MDTLTKSQEELSRWISVIELGVHLLHHRHLDASKGKYIFYDLLIQIFKTIFRNNVIRVSKRYKNRFGMY